VNAPIKVTAVVTILVYTLWGCGKRSPEQAEQQRQRESTQIKAEIDAITLHHNAITDWFKDCPEYTVQLEAALIRPDQRPILFYGVLQDVTKEQDTCRLHFALSQGCFVSAMTSGHYAVVASIAAVEKARLSLITDSLGEYKVSIEPEPASVFVATGQCLDVLSVGTYPDFFEIQSMLKTRMSGHSTSLFGPYIHFILDCPAALAESLLHQDIPTRAKP